MTTQFLQRSPYTRVRLEALKHIYKFSGAIQLNLTLTESRTMPFIRICPSRMLPANPHKNKLPSSTRSQRPAPRRMYKIPTPSASSCVQQEHETQLQELN